MYFPLSRISSHLSFYTLIIFYIIGSIIKVIFDKVFAEPEEEEVEESELEAEENETEEKDSTAKDK